MQCDYLNQTFNKHITQDDIRKSIKRHKNNKASGEDKIRNECIKATQQVMLPVYEKIFNLIFSSGKVPSIWLEGNIMPIILYKNKGGKQSLKIIDLSRFLVAWENFLHQSLMSV